MTEGDLLRLAGRAEAADLDAFLGRATRLDPGALMRLRADPRGNVVTGYLRLPFDVLVGRSVRGELTRVTDVTVRAADLAALLTAHPAGHLPDVLPMPERRDSQWRGQLPPPAGWRRVESVPVGELRRVVAAGINAYQTLKELHADSSAASPVAQDTAQALLDQDALTVSDSTDTAVLPLRVCHAAWRMGFLGSDDDAGCAVSVAGRWVRIAAPYGTVYRDPANVTLRVR